MERLPADRDTVRFDQRGWGSSRALPGPHRLDQLADDLIDIVKGLGLGLDTFALIGHSMGGKVSLLAAARPATPPAAQRPPGRFDIVPDSGHLLPLEAPAEVAAALEVFTTGL